MQAKFKLAKYTQKSIRNGLDASSVRKSAHRLFETPYMHAGNYVGNLKVVLCVCGHCKAL